MKIIYYVTGILAGIALSSTAAIAQSPSFCERMAPQLGLKPTIATMKLPPKEQEWKIDQLSFGMVMFGGSAMASFGLSPVEGATAPIDRQANTCEQNPKGALCKLTGPVRLIVQTKKKQVATDLLPGEKAEVQMRGFAIICRNGW